MTKEPAAEELLIYMELTSGRKLRTRVAIQRYLEDIVASKPVRTVTKRNRGIVQESVLVFLLLLAVLQLYFLDVYTQIYSIRTITFFVPVPLSKVKAMLEILSAVV